MAEYIVMPKLGFDMREGVLVGWNKSVGDSVKKGEVVAEIESDKATLELEAQASGILLKLLASDGDVIPIGGNLAIVGQEGEDISGMAEEGVTVDEAVVEPIKKDEEVETKALAPETPAKVIAVSDEFPGGVKASPVARRVAKERGIDLQNINGTGPGGRIIRADVESFEEAAPTVFKDVPERVPVPIGL